MAAAPPAKTPSAVRPDTEAVAIQVGQVQSLTPASSRTSASTIQPTINLLSDDPQIPEPCYLFLDRIECWSEDPDEDRSGERDRRRMLKLFDVPEFLASKTCCLHNGYFGCQPTYEPRTEANDDKGKLIKMTTWFQVLVKILTPEGKKDYEWHEMAFYTRWEAPNKHRFLCIDAPKELQDKLREALRDALLSSPPNPPNLDDPFALHAILIDQIIKFQDQSVWLLRNPVRDAERNRKDNGAAAIDFSQVHETSRHAIHISEVLEVAVHTFESLLRHSRPLYEGRDLPDSLDRTYRQRALERLVFQVQMMRSLKLRNDSTLERLKGEIQVAYNTIAQNDNRVMKSIALLTMLFLPATFISAFFSITFFNVGDDNKWRASKDIWIYFVVVVPVTIASPLVWKWWVGRGRRAGQA